MRGAINAYRIDKTRMLDEAGSSLLARLQKSTNAAKAFSRLMDGAVAFERVLEKLKQGGPLPRRFTLSPPRCNYSLQQKAAEILAICIEADGIVRSFQLEIVKGESILSRSERLDEATADLRSHLCKFVADVDKEFGSPSHLEGLAMFQAPSDHAALEQAFNLIARWINQGRSHANASIARVGATRKKRQDHSAQNAAIWLLGAQVRTVVGQPHWEEVATIANVILETDEVTGNRVRHIVRNSSDLYAGMIGDRTQRYHQEQIIKDR